MSRRPPRPTQSRSSAASDVYKRQKTLHGTSRPSTIREGGTPRSATVHPTKCTTPTDQNKWPHSKDRITVQEIQSRSAATSRPPRWRPPTTLTTRPRQPPRSQTRKSPDTPGRFSRGTHAYFGHRVRLPGRGCL